MCAPTKDLAKIAIIAGAAYATGGLSLGASGAATAGTAATTAGTAATAGTSAFNWSGMFSTLSSFAKTAAPIVGAAGTIYQGVLQSQLLKSKANFVDYSVIQDTEASALRKAKRARQLRQALATQYNKFGLTGVTLEGTPTDVLAETNAKFAEDQFLDDWNTAQGIYSKKISAGQLRAEADSALYGGILKAGMIGVERGFLPNKTPTTKTSISTLETNLLAGIRTGTEGSF